MAKFPKAPPPPAPPSGPEEHPAERVWIECVEEEEGGQSLSDCFLLLREMEPARH